MNPPTPQMKTLTERLRAENREAWRCSSGVTTVDWMDTLIAHTIAETLKSVREGVPGEKEIPTNELQDIILALRPETEDTRKETRIRDNRMFVRRLECAVWNDCRAAILAHLDSLQAETK